MRKKRVCILVMDSLGIGSSFDAINYGDEEANTFAHIYQACNASLTIRDGSGPLNIPYLTRLGLYHVALASSGVVLVRLSKLNKPAGYYGYAVEQSLGKDTPSGHWELAGVPVTCAWGYFPDKQSCFPPSLINDFLARTGLTGVLGQKHASGVHIIDELGKQHLETGMPIVYTSGDSVFQIAAHEQYFGLQRLYDACKIARELLDEYNIARVIARPFIGEVGSFKRTMNRQDYAIPPLSPTLLDQLKAAGREVIAIGKIADIFAYKGVTQVVKADGNMALFDATLAAMNDAPSGSLVVTNFVDFDSLFGHRRDVAGYAKALEEFDARIPELLALLQQDDLVVITADHGCDPTFSGFNHTREHIPVLAFGPKINCRFIGRRETFADVGQSIAEYLEIDPLLYGVSFIQ